MMLHPWLQSFGSQTSVCVSNVTMASRTLRIFERPDSVRKARSCVGAQPFSTKCFPNHAEITGWLSANSHYWTSAKPVPMPSGRVPLIDTRVIRWVGCPKRSKYGLVCQGPGKRPDSRPSCRCWRCLWCRTLSSSRASHGRALRKPSGCLKEGWQGLVSNRSFLWPWCWLRGSLRKLSRQSWDHPEFDRQPEVSRGFLVSCRCGHAGGRIC